MTMVTFRGYAGDVVIINGEKLFYTLDPAAAGHLWRNYDLYLIKTVPAGAYCWWLCSEDDVTYCDGRRRMI